MKEDILRLKQKIDAGAEYIVTQMFFDNQKYFDFVEQCVRRRRFIESTGSTTAVVASPPLHRMAVAATAAHESVAPFLVRQIRFARFFAAKLLHEFNDCQCLCHGHPGLMFQNKTLTSYPIYDVRTNPLIRLGYANESCFPN